MHHIPNCSNTKSIIQNKNNLVVVLDKGSGATNDLDVEDLLGHLENGSADRKHI